MGCRQKLCLVAVMHHKDVSPRTNNNGWQAAWGGEYYCQHFAFLYQLLFLSGMPSCVQFARQVVRSASEMDTHCL